MIYLSVYFFSTGETWDFDGNFVSNLKYIYCVYNYWISTIDFSTARGYFMITEIWPSRIMKAVRFKTKFEPAIENRWQ